MFCTYLWIILLLGGAAASAAAPVEISRRGGEFVYQRASEPSSLNPITADGHGAVDIQFHVIEPLLRLDEETQAWVPCLANHWRTLRDGKTYEFTLRPGAKWSDGKPVTSADVKFSFDVIFDSRYATAHMRPFYQGLKSVEIVNARTVRFHARNTYFGNFISSAGLPIVPKHIYNDSSLGPQLSRTLIGSGPYKVASWEPSLRIVLERNPLWWGLSARETHGEYNPNRVVFRFVNSETLALSMLAKGELDFVPLSLDAYFMRTDGPLWGKQMFKARVQNKYPKASKFIAFNLERPLFQDIRVRRALNELVDRDLMIRKFKYGMAVPAAGPWYRQSVYADPSVQAPSFNPADALRQLREAGWRDHDGDGVLDKDGHLLAFEILTSSHEAERTLTVLQEDAKQVGVQISIRFVDGSLLPGRIDRREYDALQVDWGGGLVDFDPKPMWHSASIGPGGNNFAGYSSSKVDRLIELARHTRERMKRIPLMREIYRTIAADVPCLFLINDDSEFYAYSSRVERPRDTYAYEVGTKYWWVKL